jgi:hypothetical protein
MIMIGWPNGPKKVCQVRPSFAGPERSQVAQSDESRRIAANIAKLSEPLREGLVGHYQFDGGQTGRMFKLVSASLAGPHVPNTTLGQMLRPFWCNDSGTALRALRDRPFTHGDLAVPDTNESMLSQNQAGLSDPDQLLLQDLSDSSAADWGPTSRLPELLRKS